MPYFHNDKVNVLFIHIPKTGGTSIEKYFSKKFKIDLSRTALYGFDRTFSRISLQHQTLATIYDKSKRFDICIDTSFRIVTSVRNPYTRLMSHLYYLNKIHNHMNPTQVEDIIYKHFKAYDRCNHRYDNHLLPQHKFLKNKEGIIDNNIIILKQESLTDDMKKAGFMDDTSPMYNENVCITKAKFKNYYSQMNMNIISLVNRYYKEDFECFAYEMITSEEQLRQLQT